MSIIARHSSALEMFAVKKLEASRPRVIVNPKGILTKGM